MDFNFEEYQQKAFSSCLPSCFNGDYLHYGLISEIGEFAGKLAKQIRGDRICRDDIKAELGDIAWFIAVRALLKKEDLNADIHAKYFVKWSLQDQLYKTSIDLISIVLLTSRSSAILWLCLQEICKEQCFDFNDVLKSNNKKLASRKARGKIGGSGDNR